MNKQQRQKLEDMMRQLAEEPYNPSEAHIEEIKRQAFEEYDQIMAAKQKMKEKRKSIRRRVVVTAAAIVCLLIGSTVIALLNPLQSGNADNFFRRAVIWINDQLHLGIELPALEQDNTPLMDHMSSYSSIEEGLQNIHMPLIGINSDKMKLEKIDYISNKDNTSVIIHYSEDDNSFIIRIEPISDDNSYYMFENMLKEVNTNIGTVYILNSGNNTRAFAIYDGLNIIFTSTLNVNVFEDYLGKIKIFN